MASATTHDVAKWVATIAARPAVKRAMAKVAAISSARDSATEDAKERFLARGKYARA
jgi:hypothetical protein